MRRRALAKVGESQAATASANQDLARMPNQLRDLMERFQVDGEDQVERRAIETRAVAVCEAGDWSNRFGNRSIGQEKCHFGY
jgi:hypothetical protein